MIYIKLQMSIVTLIIDII